MYAYAVKATNVIDLVTIKFYRTYFICIVYDYSVLIDNPSSYNTWAFTDKHKRIFFLAKRVHSDLHTHLYRKDILNCTKQGAIVCSWIGNKQRICDNTYISNSNRLHDHCREKCRDTFTNLASRALSQSPIPCWLRQTHGCSVLLDCQ